MTERKASADQRLVVVYERVSSSQQDLARQAIQRERARSDYPGHQHVVLEEEGVSAYRHSIFERPEGRRLVAMIEAGKVEAIYADALDRLTRGDADAEWSPFRVLCRATGTRIVIDGRELRDDLGGRLEGHLKALLARMESEEKSHRVKGGLKRVVTAGRYLGPRRPYGYTFEGERQERLLVVQSHEASVIRCMADWYEGGDGDASIAARLNAQGEPSPTGQTWDKSQVRNVLVSPIVAGYVYLRERDEEGRLIGRELFDGLHEAILPPDRWERLQTVRANRRGKGRRPSGGHLFTGGLLRCPDCRSGLRPRTTPRGYAYYECSGRWRKDRPTACSQSNLDARTLEGMIVAHLLTLTFDPDETRARIEAAAGELRERARAVIAAADKRVRLVERKRERVMREYVGTVSPAVLTEAVALLDAEREQAEAHAAELLEAATAAEAEAADIDAERSQVTRLEWLQAVIRGTRDQATVERIRDALSTTFERIYMAEDTEPGSLLVIPKLKQEFSGALVVIPVAEPDTAAPTRARAAT